MIKQQSRLDIRKHFFSQRVVNQWNNLSQKVVDAPSINGFKNALDGRPRNRSSHGSRSIRAQNCSTRSTDSTWIGPRDLTRLGRLSIDSIDRLDFKPMKPCSWA